MAGRLYVVGMGPGSYEQMTIQAARVLEQAQVLAGYTAYVERAARYFPGKEVLAAPMRQEVSRCRQAFARAAEGAVTALVCGGDAGISGMAGLVLEHQGIGRRRRVQHRQGGVLSLLHGRMVISLGQHPVPGRNLFPGNIAGNLRPELFKVDAAGQIHLQQAVGHGGEMAVGIQEGRQHRPACQINLANVHPGPFLHIFPAACGDNPAAPDQQRLCRRHVSLHGADGSIFKENVHEIPPQSPVYRIRARSIPRVGNFRQKAVLCECASSRAKGLASFPAPPGAAKLRSLRRGRRGKTGRPFRAACWFSSSGCGGAPGCGRPGR